MSKTDRVLVLLPVVEGGAPAWGVWGAAMAAQRAKTPWDALVIDTTDQPSDGYLATARSWAKSHPFGANKVRLKHFTDEPHIITPYDHAHGAKVEGVEMDDEEMQVVGGTRTTFSAPWQRVAWGRAIGSRYFQKWSSYTHLLYADPEVLPPKHGLSELYSMSVGWVAGWRNPGAWGVPEVWRDLHAETLDTPFDPADKGYMEPPGDEAFTTSATHLGFTLTNRDIHDTVDFQVDYVRSDLSFSWQVASAGFALYCNPAVECRGVGQTTP